MSLHEDTKLLVMSHDADLRVAIARCFSSEGFSNVHYAVDLQHALEQLGEGGFECIVVDSTMPEHEGVELQRKVRIKHLGPIPFVFIQASDCQGLRVASPDIGATIHVSRPHSFERMMQAIKGVLETHVSA